MVVGALVAVIVGLDLTLSGWIPTGADPGNWLAVARELLGMNSMSTDVIYPPLVPVLVSGLLILTGPLTAIGLVALVARAAMAIAVYICALPAGRASAVVAASVVAVASAQVEAYSWGAYPQMTATSFAVLGVYYVNRYMGSRQVAHFSMGLVFSVLTAATHLLVAGLFLVAIPISLIHRHWMLRLGWRAWNGMWQLPILALAPSLFYVSSQMLNQQLEPVLNPLGVGRLTSLVESFNDAGPLWLVVLAVAAGALVWRGWADPRLATVSSASSWMLVGLLFFLLTAERRALVPAQVGLIVLAAVGFRRLYGEARVWAKAHRARLVPSGVRSGVVVVLGISTVSGILVGGVGDYSDTRDWYRVVDMAEVRALDHLGDGSVQGDLVVASRGKNGIQLGWWVEGYVGIPTYSGLDPRFAAFREEREQAEIANVLFSGQLTDEETMAELEEIGADFLVVDRRGPDAGWLEGDVARSFPVLHDSATVVVLLVPT